MAFFHSPFYLLLRLFLWDIVLWSFLSNDRWVLSNFPGISFSHLSFILENRLLSNRIVNGTAVRPRHKYPWYVRLAIGTDTSHYLCGGTIISERYVLTAAHCVSEVDKEAISVHYGVHSYKPKDGVPVAVEKVICDCENRFVEMKHGPSYNDYCLLKLEKSLDLSDRRIGGGMIGTFHE